MAVTAAARKLTSAGRSLHFGQIPNDPSGVLDLLTCCAEPNGSCVDVSATWVVPLFWSETDGIGTCCSSPIAAAFANAI